MPTTLPLEVRPATAADVPALAQLFDAYRVFYEADSAPMETAAFVGRLVVEGRTRFFLAREAQPETNALLGFVHLMPSINTVAMRPIWLLEDLFVAPEARRQGVAVALMRHAEAFARRTGAERLTLATAHDNLKAQALYKRLGYLPEEHFWYFHLSLE
jgi:ribosomal protein S18 acetylase RimI-like enzyme